jgi:hypothetical protein
MGFSFHRYIVNHIEFSFRTFGPGAKTQRIINHIKKELVEIEKKPKDRLEWADLIILAIDGAWREGISATQLIEALVEKQQMNQNREWPDWRGVDPNKPIEHVRKENE